MKLVAAAVFMLGSITLAASSESAPPAGGAGAQSDSSSCVVCHRNQEEANLSKPVALWTKDIHSAAGLGCQDCHGGNPARLNIEDEDEAADAAMDPARGFRPAPDRLAVPGFCARCHSDPAYMKRFNPKARVDQLIEYRTSVHGQLNAKGDPVPATCIDCHGAHGIRSISSPEARTYATNVPKLCANCHADSTVMAPYKIPTNQYAEYRQSVHATALLDNKDLAAPACNDCHGNHGAAPPEARSVSHVCGQCHGREEGLYSQSIKPAIFARLKMPECITCHGNHGVRHPTPDLFDGHSAPSTSRGSLSRAAPLSVEVEELAQGDSATIQWRNVLALHLPAEDPRYSHSVEISADGIAPVTLDATVRPGTVAQPSPVRLQNASGLAAILTVAPLSGLPIESGDALGYRLSLMSSGGRAIRGLRVRDLPGSAVNPHPGSVCLKCHQVGDSCDVATEGIFATLQSLDRKIREAEATLNRAEVAGMEVSLPQYELKRNGISAAVEARALIHSFQYERILKRATEGAVVASAASLAGRQSLVEMDVRRRGLWISLVLIAMVLVGLAFKIRQIDRERESRSSTGSTR